MLTLAEAGQAKLVEKRSRFLAFAFPIQTQEDIQRHLAELGRRHHAARHIAYAWRLAGEEGAHDAGEPRGTAGLPILQLLRARGIEGALVAVVRYFGGVKLGVGGLCRAYREAARLALEAAGVVERTPVRRVRVRTPLAKLGATLGALARLGAKVHAQDYTGAVVLEVELPAGREGELRELLAAWAEVEGG